MSHCESCILQSQCFYQLHLKYILNNLGSIFVNSFFQFFGLRDWPHLIRLPTGMGVNLTLRWIKLSEGLYFLQVVSWCQMATYMTGSWRWFLPDYHFLDGGHALLDLVRVIFLFFFQKFMWYYLAILWVTWSVPLTWNMLFFFLKFIHHSLYYCRPI